MNDINNRSQFCEILLLLFFIFFSFVFYLTLNAHKIDLRLRCIALLEMMMSYNSTTGLSYIFMLRVFLFLLFLLLFVIIQITQITQITFCVCVVHCLPIWRCLLVDKDWFQNWIFCNFLVGEAWRIGERKRNEIHCNWITETTEADVKRYTFIERIIW